MKKRNIAIFAALTLLCGCNGNTESTSSRPESVPATVEESVPEQTSVENSSAPAGVTVPEQDSTTPGVSLGAGDWTEYDSVFKLRSSPLPGRNTSCRTSGLTSTSHTKPEMARFILSPPTSYTRSRALRKYGTSTSPPGRSGMCIPEACSTI